MRGPRPGKVLAPVTLDEETMRRMHRRYAAGLRDAATVEGERQYQRQRRRVQRARNRAEMSDPTTTI